ncbi:alpha/beta fold hydrolase [Agrococcus sp. DT81.2]|uniref:alpha/beta fold hydrolase n=1 Tax=Agrococcus sp. DT81.2 TaxID=3393414 RepID=UPI003CE5543B
MTTTKAARPSMPTVVGVDHTWVDLPDGRMHVATMGSGEPVLLLAGFAQTWWAWRRVMPALAAAGYRAIAPDLRGEGWSELPSRAITRTRRADDVIALLDALGHDRARLVSHDIGAITALQLTLSVPHRFPAQVMLAVPPPQLRFSIDLLPGMRHLWHQEVLALPVIGAGLLRAGRVTPHLFTHFAARPLHPEVIALADAMLRTPELSLAAARLCRRVVLPELARIIRGVYRRQRFAMPCLFVFGTEDIAFPPHITRKVFDDTSAIGARVQLALVAGAGHFVVEEQPDAAITVITEFLAAV